VESSCELGNEPSSSIKCWELPSGCTSCGLSSGTQLHRVSYLVIWRSLPITIFNTYQGASTILLKTLDWKRSGISVFEVEVIPYSCIPQVQIVWSTALHNIAPCFNVVS
jgi:hypothetical protein